MAPGLRNPVILLVFLAGSIAQDSSDCVSRSFDRQCTADAECSIVCQFDNQGIGLCGQFKSTRLCYCNGCPKINTKLFPSNGTAESPITSSTSSAPGQLTMEPDFRSTTSPLPVTLGDTSETLITTMPTTVAPEELSNTSPTGVLVTEKSGRSSDCLSDTCRFFGYGFTLARCDAECRSCGLPNPAAFPDPVTGWMRMVPFPTPTNATFPVPSFSTNVTDGIKDWTWQIPSPNSNSTGGIGGLSWVTSDSGSPFQRGGSTWKTMNPWSDGTTATGTLSWSSGGSSGLPGGGTGGFGSLASPNFPFQTGGSKGAFASSFGGNWPFPGSRLTIFGSGFPFSNA